MSPNDQALVDAVARLEHALKSAKDELDNADRRQAEKAQCWDLLMGMCGYTQNSSDRVVKLHQDDATHTRHITVISNDLPWGKKDYWGGSFEAAIRSAAAAGECTE